MKAAKAAEARSNSLCMVLSRRSKRHTTKRQKNLRYDWYHSLE